MKARASLSLVVVLLLAVGCVPLPPPAAPAATSMPVTTPANTALTTASATASAPAITSTGWQTYDNPEIGFSIQYPPSWTQTLLSSSPPSYGVMIEGPEGAVELWWGTPIDGQCPVRYSNVRVAGGEVPACHTLGSDGSQYWNQINKQLATTRFSGRAHTKDAAQASGEQVLAVLATLTFAEGAQPSTATWQTYENRDVGFSIQTPPDWIRKTTSASPPTYGIEFDGPEGVIGLQWGVGFGGSDCPPDSVVMLKTADGEIQACHRVAADGAQHWENFGKELPATSLRAYAYTNDATQASTNVLLAALATLSFDVAALPGPSAGWQTYTNPEGFSIQYPPDWTQNTTSASPPIYGVAFEGPEGMVELQWGSGFGGACITGGTALRVAQGQLSGCETVWDDGSRHWEQIYKIMPNTGFGARALTRDGKGRSAELVLDVLSTLTFGESPAGQATPATTLAPVPGMEIVVDNADSEFWSEGNWYILRSMFHPKAQMQGDDCYLARPGLDSADVHPNLPAGAYEVFARWCGDPGAKNQSTNGIIEVYRSSDDPSPEAVGVNYQAGIGQWQSLGAYDLHPGAFLRVKGGLNGSVIADAYRFVYAGSALAAPAQAVPTPLPSGVIVSNHPPSPLQQLTSGDLASRLALVDPFYASVPMTATQQTFDDCQAFPREGCSGTRPGWQAAVTYQDISLTYRVSDDYKLVAVEGADGRLSPWIMGQDKPQLIFLRGSLGATSFTVQYDAEGSWHLLRWGNGSTADSEVTLTHDQGGLLYELAPKYSTLYLQQPDGSSVVFYGLGTTVAPSDADREDLLELAAQLAAMPR